VTEEGEVSEKRGMTSGLAALRALFSHPERALRESREPGSSSSEGEKKKIGALRLRQPPLRVTEELRGTEERGMSEERGVTEERG
jgi:hypothetical protein